MLRRSGSGFDAQLQERYMSLLADAANQAGEDMAQPTKVLTVRELSNYLRVHPSTIYRLLKKGELPGFKVGSDWRFNIEAIDRWRLERGPHALEELEKMVSRG